jgi:hypothetical protein
MHHQAGQHLVYGALVEKPDGERLALYLVGGLAGQQVSKLLLVLQLFGR